MMALEYPRKYWWLVLIIVPIVVAIIQIVPDFDQDEDKRNDGIIRVQVSGPQFNGDVAFNTVNVVMEQAERTLQKQIPKGVLEILQQAMDLLQSQNFEKASPLLQSAAQRTPVPALFNNLGAAYLATGNLQEATEYIEKARTGSDEEAAAFNLKQIEATQKQATPIPDENGASVNFGLGNISIPNSEVRTAEVYDQHSPAEGTYSEGFSGKISPDANIIYVPAGIYKLKFAKHFLEKVEVRGGTSTEIMLGTISMPNLRGRTVEVYSQDSDAQGTYSAGFAGKISPDEIKLQVPAGTYKLKFAKHFLENIVVRRGQEVVL